MLHDTPPTLHTALEAMMKVRWATRCGCGQHILVEGSRAIRYHGTLWATHCVVEHRRRRRAARSH